MKAKPAHLTFLGRPVCRCSWMLEKYGITCSYVSIAAANRALKKVQKVKYGFRVVRGPCPTTS